MVELRDRLTVGDACAVAYTMLVTQLDRANELKYQAHLTALYMGGEGEPPNLAEMQQQSRDLLDSTLSEKNELTTEQRTLREALGLKVW